MAHREHGTQPPRSAALQLRLDQSFDLVDGMIGKGFGNFLDHRIGHFLVHFAAQFAQHIGGATITSRSKAPAWTFL